MIMLSYKPQMQEVVLAGKWLTNVEEEFPVPTFSLVVPLKMKEVSFS
jgi:hypothetical protein